MRMGSLFSGIGGLEMGLEAALGAETVWQVESNPYARAVLEKHRPHTKRYDDVGEVGRGTLESVELILGGFPCQGASSAGKRKGLKDERSGLWFEYARIIRELEPRWVVIENVPGLSSRGLDRVLGSLASLGYDAVWDCLSAAAVGAPHIRDRIFIIAWRQMADAHREGKLQQEGAIQQKRGRAGDGSKEEYVAHPDGQGLEERESQRRGFPPELSTAMRACGAVADTERDGWLESPEMALGREPFSSMQSRDDSRISDPRWIKDQRQWLIEPNVGRVAHGVPSRVDKLRCLGNAVVPQCSYVIGMWLLQIKQWLEES